MTPHTRPAGHAGPGPSTHHNNPARGLRVAWCTPVDASAQALALLLQHLGCAAQRCEDNTTLRAFMARRDAQGRLPWLVVALDSAPGHALLASSRSWLDPDRVVGIGALADTPHPLQDTDTDTDTDTDADTGRDSGAHGASAPHSHARTALCAALARRFTRVAAAALPPPAAAPAEALASPPPRGRVLLAEDEAINQAVVQAMLEHAGYDCLLANNGHSALALLQHTTVDLVLMDWQMPGIDGLETTRRLRQGAAGAAAQHLPVVALTANAFAEDRAACMAAGMNDYLTKPVLADQLAATLARWIGEPTATPGTGKVVGAAAVAPDASTGAPAYDPRLLATLPMVADGSDPGFVTHLLAQFDLQASQDIRDAAQALADGDLATLQRLVHTLKGSAGQVGALALAHEAARQEAALRAGQAPCAQNAQRLAAQLEAYRTAQARHAQAAVALPGAAAGAAAVSAVATATA